MTDYAAWTPRDAAAWIAVPRDDDDKYSRGVLGVVTGSDQYPGAAVLGVEAALHTGVGMLRYLGPERAASFVLQRRPEAVTSPGRVQAYLLGSGIDPDTLDGVTTERFRQAAASGVPLVLDAGALSLRDRTDAPVVVTPHFRELAKATGRTVDDIAADPAAAAIEAAETWGATVLLKGHSTYVASPNGVRLVAASAPSWLATAGAGDALGGILGALVATHADAIDADEGALARLAATAAVVHGLAASRASGGGPLTVLGLVDRVPATIAALLADA
ncbi:Bifunctional NAD(P)H-hydrate repair enzyme Nnr [Frondihabitans sp. 762G35]|uniref:ADP-dependent NAD(P)H-hydrate dehydratase n=1 Tax=Frondihabitans sp. 762G35 TaxID=1446794 RepID=UPI000D206BB8|nr:ADP/ATP-dependent (S)-NAD(P)H-hydrate dehydratase [Frondihabitans sp. 762G35]ARC57253.1 Bifunctional NAD(P)H-hydrate repair enzyme Nnr [Frondihabitans sp. 762G35]